MNDILDKIIVSTKARLGRAMRETSCAALEARIATRRPVRNPLNAFARPGLHIIAEVKRASPSRGVILADADAVGVASVYETAGASAVSVLTEQDHFKGRLEDLADVSRTVSIPVLRKDFIIDTYQILEAAAYGADFVLLIARLFEAAELRALIEYGKALDMEALVETHDRRDVDTALEAGAKLIGVNNRDLATFRTDLQVTAGLIPFIPSDCIVVSESGIKTREDVVMLSGLGVRVFLVGEELMKADNPAVRIAELKGLASTPADLGPKMVPR
jgi:indole-3-glycerol phosphate synthase